MNFFERITRLCKEKNSLLCVGLDPRVEASTDEEAEKLIIEQNRKLIEATAPYTVCYKPNIAFYEAWGEAGHRALMKTVEMIPDEIPVLLDAKRGDIGATAEAYAVAAFEQIGADAITLSPYMGESSAEPFLKYEEKGFFQLCRTSNPKADLLQELKTEAGVPFFIEVARQATGWAKERTGLVVAGNDPISLKAVREALPEVWFLSPGIGAQGGSMVEAVAAGMRQDGLGILPVVVRAIAQADDPAQAAKSYVEQLNRARAEVLQSEQSRQAETPLMQTVLKGLIDTDCFRLGEFTLKSGKQSPFYVDLRRTSSSPLLMKQIATAYATLLKGIDFDLIAGIPVAALPLATALSLETGVPMIYPRINKKGHGTGNLIEGNWEKGDRVLLLDDLITTGKSKVEAVEILREAGLVVEDLVVLLERGVQGRKDMEAIDIRLHAFAPVEKLFQRCFELDLIDAKKKQELLDYTMS